MNLRDHLDADDCLSIRDGELWLEDCRLSEVAAEFGTPLHVVSEERLRRRAREFVREFSAEWPDGPVQVLPSIKANFSLALRRILTQEGLGCDTFGASELRAALACGVPPELISVNGSSKSRELIEEAVRAGCHVTLDSLREAELVVAVAEDVRPTAARGAPQAPVVVRVRLRPDFSGIDLASEFGADGETMPDVAGRYKPGVPHEDLEAVARLLRGSARIEVTGVHVHIGRHRPDTALWSAMLPRYAREIASFAALMGGDWYPRIVDVGGGFSPRRDPAEAAHAVGDDDHVRDGADAGDAGPREVPTVRDYARAACAALRAEMERAGLPLQGAALQLEPGRSIYANAGLHLTTVTNLKAESRTGGSRRWVETDTSEAFLPDVNIEGARWTAVAVGAPEAPAAMTADIVGISCGFDVVVAAAHLPELAAGDVVALLDTGAYQDAGACNFNAMPRPGTVLVHGAEVDAIKRSETIDEVFSRDVVPRRLGTVARLGNATTGART